MNTVNTMCLFLLVLLLCDFHKSDIDASLLQSQVGHHADDGGIFALQLNQNSHSNEEVSNLNNLLGLSHSILQNQKHNLILRRKCEKRASW